MICMNEKRFVCYFDDILKKWCVQDTDSLDMHYVADEKMGEEFAHLLNLYQQGLDEVEKENWQLKKENEWLKSIHVANDVLKENDELKKQLKNCKDARQSYKQDWKACVNYCDTYKNEIHDLEDNLDGLKEENVQLKKEKDYYKRELQKELVCQAIIDGREKND